MEKFDLLTAAKSNWIATREVLAGCSLSAEEQLARVDLDELFVIDGIVGVSWMFEDLQWFGENEIARQTQFDAAVEAVFSLGDAVFDDDTVRSAVEWAQLRAVANDFLAVLPERPWDQRAAWYVTSRKVSGRYLRARWSGDLFGRSA
jgi:hypothetical protein